jgi:hypothetical protein
MSTRRVATLWGAGAVLAGLVAAGFAGGQLAGEPSAGPKPGMPVPASAVHRLTAVAEQAAKLNGGAAPAWVSAVVTTHKQALTSATPGDSVPIGERAIVYLVTMKGHFIATMASTPPGQPLPTGGYLSIVVNAKTLQTMDWGLSHRPPAVAPARIGPVIYLKIGATARQ